MGRNDRRLGECCAITPTCISWLYPHGAGDAVDLQGRRGERSSGCESMTWPDASEKTRLPFDGSVDVDIAPPHDCAQIAA
jgi:hypothetical protein